MIASATVPRAPPTPTAIAPEGRAAGPETRRLRLGRHEVAVDLRGAAVPVRRHLHLARVPRQPAPPPGAVSRAGGRPLRPRRPLRVLWGDRDPFFPVAVGERTASAGRGTLRVLPGCGHFVPEERAEEVAAEVAAQACAR